ncbi:MAG: transposase [Syntrophaceae bacterium]|nr:transposase [Syntrophaceae bacterium]
MPRKSRIDASGALHHIIVRGIERRKIFLDNADRNNFIDRVGGIVAETNTTCYAWALIPNHAHLLLRTGQVPAATVMRRLLTGHAGYFNKRHRRSGHLFQNRYKSILCQEDSYLLELVRYIHLNPLRAKIVQDVKELKTYPFCGHSALMGEIERDWQEIDRVLKMFGQRVSDARRRYQLFVKRGISVGRREDLTGGGLIRSMGGWQAVKTMRRNKVFEKSDERILGNGIFVEQVLSKAKEQMERKHRLKSKGFDLEMIADRVGSVMEIDASEIWKSGKLKDRVAARSLFCFWAVRELGVSMTEVSRRLKLSLSGVSQSVIRGEKIAEANGFELLEE